MNSIKYKNRLYILFPRNKRQNNDHCYTTEIYYFICESELNGRKMKELATLVLISAQTKLCKLKPPYLTRLTLFILNSGYPASHR